jgi:23S rRNA pseudouridine1911/1915/1917 synthase
MSTPLTLPVPEDAANTRLDVWLVAALAAAGQDFSRAGVQRLIREGFVTRDGAPREGLEANPAKKVRAGEVYRVDIPAAVAAELVAEDIPLAILYEDNDLIVLDKPVGLAVHPSPGHDTGTLVHALLHHCRGSLSGINGEMRPGIVHRLDKDTSGVMVAAKNDVAHRGLAGQFARHSLHRKYLALVRGVPRPLVGRIEGAIGRHPVSRLKRAVVNDGGKHAVTHYAVAERFGQNGQDTAALVACTLETGRTHQIRVHLAHRGHPLLGDRMYGNANPLKGLKEPLPLPRQMLHAAELGFEHPVSGKRLDFATPPPADMQAALEILRG